MKKGIALLLAMLCMLTVLPAAADTPEIKVVVNGTNVEFDQPPVIQNNRTLVPLRAIFEALGANVYWIEDTRTILAGLGDQIVMLQIDNDSLFKGEEIITLDVPAQIIGNRTMVPVRAISEAFGAEVDWDQETYTVIVTK